MDRRTFLRSVGTGVTGIALAGCVTTESGGGETTTSGGSPTESETTTSGTGTATETRGETTAESTPTATPDPDLEGTLRVATYSAFVSSPSSSPGAWLKEAFEERYPNATLKYETPNSGINYYLQRRRQGAGIDADVYVGLNTDELIRIDDKLSGKRLFRRIDEKRLDNAGHVIPELKVDPKGRALPYDTGYISLVYDERTVSAPGTFEALAKPEYEGTLLAENAQTSDTGKAFLLWTIHTLGEDQYLDYWQRLIDNDVRILENWDKAYAAYGDGQRPMVVSYSTDQVYANRYDQNMKRHQVGFLNDQGYANPEGMAVFETTDEPDLARAFVDFMLSKPVQSKLPVLNVQYPATDHADMPAEFEKYAYTPDEPVTFTYDELKGNVETWVDEWARQIASK
ncbi:MAG: thiamine transport system substrate-binding protein [Halobacteriales archaeon]|jgi:thiamine transport system substrate-binding protein